MDADKIPPGRVFVSYAREDHDRVRPLVDYLKRAGMDVFWDEDLEPGSRFRSALADALELAACVVVVWTRTSVQRDFVQSEAARGDARGALIPVKLDADAQVPLGFDVLQYVDLHGWDGSDTATSRRLVNAVRKLVERGSNGMSHHAMLSENSAIANAQRMTGHLVNLTSRLRSLGDTLVADSAPAKDLRGALDEVRKTYSAVSDAIRRFVTPAVQRGPIDGAPYVDMERGTLVSDIENGRGHCSRINAYYFRDGGLRDSIKDGIDPQLLTEVDQTFSQLSHADVDLFDELTQIGRVLTNESRAIVNLLVEEQDVAARRRILEGRQALAPLEKQLSGAMVELQRVERSLGHATPSDTARASGP
jgi:hypothetical protein